MMLHPAVQQHCVVQYRLVGHGACVTYEQRGVFWRSFSGSVASRWRGQDHLSVTLGRVLKFFLMTESGTRV